MKAIIIKILTGKQSGKESCVKGLKKEEGNQVKNLVIKYK
jgi:hypothetical protein